MSHDLINFRNNFDLDVFHLLQHLRVTLFQRLNFVTFVGTIDNTFSTNRFTLTSEAEVAHYFVRMTVANMLGYRLVLFFLSRDREQCWLLVTCLILLFLSS